MGRLTQYRSLFSVRILHEYYLPVEPEIYQNIPADNLDSFQDRLHGNYNINGDFKISPTSDCNEALNNYNLVFKRNRLGCFVAGKVRSLGGGDFTSYIPMDEPETFRFTLDLGNKNLFNFTNIRLERNIESKDYFVYYFSNRANNSGAGAPLYLTRPVADFLDTYAYEAGEVILSMADPLNPVMLEALEDNGPGVFNGANWQQVYSDVDPLPQFVTNLDRIVLRPGIFKHNVELAGRERLRFVFRDRAADVVKTQEFRTTQSGTPLVECEVDLEILPDAKYTLEVQDELGTVIPQLRLEFYKDNVLFEQRPFALIECFHEPDGSLADYRVLEHDNDNRLLSPGYTIGFKNRSTFWRYHFSEAPSFTSAQMEVYETSPGNPVNEVLVSNQPLGLTQMTRQVEIDVSGESLFLPNPGVSSIYPENGRIYSEINMGGGLGPVP